MRVSTSESGLERIEARFHGNGFSPHRHDTYALGLTLHGVQTFHYRGTAHHSEPGKIIILHPDEVHDGAAGTDIGLIYRMVYLPPALLSAAGDFRSALPFVADPVATDAPLWQALADILRDLDKPAADLLLDDVAVRILHALERRSGATPRPMAPSARSAVLRAIDFLEAADTVVRSTDLEGVSGLDRYELARQFRRLTGTSPHRYTVMRRLDRAKQMMLEGCSLADAAAGAGFADQAHMTRCFHKGFGMPPGRWLSMRKAGRLAELCFFP